MNTQQFVELVAKMRAADRLYFKQRTRTHLDAAIDLEKQVDKAISEGVWVEGEGLVKIELPDKDQMKLL